MPALTVGKRVRSSDDRVGICDPNRGFRGEPWRSRGSPVPSDSDRKASAHRATRDINAMSMSMSIHVRESDGSYCLPRLVSQTGMGRYRYRRRRESHRDRYVFTFIPDIWTDLAGGIGQMSRRSRKNALVIHGLRLTSLTIMEYMRGEGGAHLLGLPVHRNPPDRRCDPSLAPTFQPMSEHERDHDRQRPVVVGEGEVEPGDRVRLLATDDAYTTLAHGDTGTVEDIAELPTGTEPVADLSNLDRLGYRRATSAARRRRSIRGDCR